MPPYNLLVLASLVPDEFDVKIYDENIEKIPELDSDLIAISCTSRNSKRAYEIGDTYLKKGIKVIMGGIHPSFMPDETLKHCSSVVIGEAEGYWRRILEDFKKNRLKKMYNLGHTNDMSKIPVIKWDLIKDKNYKFKGVIQTTRGCPYNCDFCSVAVFAGKKIRQRPINDVINDIKNSKSKAFFIIDDNIFANRSYSKRLFKRLQKLNIRWIAQAPVSIGYDKEMLREAYKAGCRMLFVGFESIVQDMLNNIHKFNNVKEYKKIIKNIQDSGIMVWGTFIFGFDFEQDNAIENTLEFCNENNMEAILFSTMYAYPGTRLYDRMKKQKRVTEFYQVIPKQNSIKYYQKKILEADRKFYLLNNFFSMFFRMLIKYPWQIERLFWFSVVFMHLRKGLKKRYLEK